MHFQTVLIRLLVISIVSIGVCYIGIPTIIHAQTSGTAYTFSQTKEQLNELQKVQGDAALPTYEKELKEITLRRTILENVVTIAQTQINDAQTQIEKITLDDQSPWHDIRADILEHLLDAHTYYVHITTQLATDTITIDDLKNIAKELDTYKTTTIDPIVREANTIAARFHIGALLDVADDRLTKIGVDVNRIYNQKLTEDEAIRTLLKQATISLQEGQTTYHDVSDMLLHIYNPVTASSSEYLQAYDKQFTVDHLTNEIDTSTDSSTQLRMAQATVNTTTQNLLTKIVSDIKSAYAIFIRMSTQVKEYLP